MNIIPPNGGSFILRLYRYWNSPKRSIHFTFLFCVWLFGLMIGILLANTFDSFFQIKQFVAQDSTPILVFLSFFIPISCTIISLNRNFYFACYPIIFIEAISKGFVSFFLYSLLGSSAWLLRIFLLINGNFSALFLWFYLIDHFCNLSQIKMINLRNIFVWAIVLVLSNFFLSSNFLHTIIQYI